MNDIEFKESAANEWGVLYKREFEIESFFCFGCKSERTFELCSQCDIKGCNQKRNLRSCPDCSEYPCERIKEFKKYQIDNNTGVE